MSPDTAVAEHTEEEVEQTDEERVALPAADREIAIVRLEDEQSHLPSTVLNEATKNLSSVLVNQRPHMLTGPDPRTGRDWEEWVSDIIGVSRDEGDFGRQMRDFWKEMTIPVPSGGYQLHIGLDGNRNPISVEDYVQYHWARTHPNVFEDRNEAQQKRPGVDGPVFWIRDPKREIQKENEDVQKQKVAKKEYFKVEDDPDKMDLMVRVVTGKNPEQMTQEEKENALWKESQRRPDEFTRAARDKGLEARAKIEEAVEYEVIRRIGNQYIYNDITLGSSMEEVVAWFKDARNSKQVTQIKAKISEKKG